MTRYDKDNDRETRRACLKKKKSETKKCKKYKTVVSKFKMKVTSKKPKKDTTKIAKKIESKNFEKITINKSKRVTTTRPEKVATSKPKKRVTNYIKMKYQLYRDINALRKKYSKPPLKVNVTLSKELQKYAQIYVNNFSGKTPKAPLNGLYYFSPPDREYNPIKKWRTDEESLKDDYFMRGIINLPFTRLIWKSSTHIGCGVYGSKTGVITVCVISPMGKYKENPSKIF
uniref:SCP domain-containing protein n=1 Tax=Strongyloides papillosus TaxID=174720 RepID=A0A0N5CAZ6_STREA